MQKEMMGNSFLIIFLGLFVCILNAKPDDVLIDLTKEPGHLKKFGTGRPSQPIDEVTGFPTAGDFFRDYVSVLRPLKMTGAAHEMKAFKQWTDDYFSGLEVLDKEEVLIESRKKENRTNPTTFMSLREFVKIYNESDEYMVNSVPRALRPDMFVPCPVQCEPVLNEALVDALMWFSSGGTKSVVHTDAVENINCLMRGQKEFIMVDPLLYGDKVDLDHPEGSYSDIDVDAVDYTKYPGLAEVNFFHVNITAGDCLYIPYRWIHQVRSYDSNIAVNIWWDHHKTADIDASLCTKQCDYGLTLDKVTYIGFSASLDSVDSLRDHINQILGVRENVQEEKFLSQFLGNDTPDSVFSGTGYQDLIKKIFRILDLDKDGSLTKQEIKDVDEDGWEKARAVLLQLEALLREIEMEYNEAFENDPEAFDDVDSDIPFSELKDEL